MTERKVVENNGSYGFASGRIEYYEDHGDCSTLDIFFDDSSNTGEPPQSMRIVGSIEISQFFALIDRVRVGMKVGELPDFEASNITEEEGTVQ
jgi:hypothetical protein